MASVLLSFEVLVLGEANGHGMRILTPAERFPKQENEGFMPAAVLEVDLPAPVKSSDKQSLSCHPDCKLLGDLEPEQPN